MMKLLMFSALATASWAAVIVGAIVIVGAFH